MQPRFKTVPGTYDILPEDTWKWQYIEQVIREILARHNYREIRTPAFEFTELFSRSVGKDTDIVSKEMYTFEDRQKRSLTLKPELTAPVIRAYVQNRLDQRSPLTRLYYIDALFRHERQQKGRQRQFHQFGFELIGSPHPEADAEVIAIIYDIYESLSLTRLKIQLNSVGSRESRPGFIRQLQSTLDDYRNQFCSTCQERLVRNPLRLFDCKNENCQRLLDQHAPSILDSLSEEDRHHFERVQECLDYLQIPFTVNHKLVRGLDYYSRTTFEINSPDLGAQDALCGGGRYDYLVEELGGPPTPAVGVAAGMERLILVLEKINFFNNPPRIPQVYIVVLDEELLLQALRMRQELTRESISCDLDLLRRSIKAQMREANRQNARFAIILGSNEIKSRKVTIKDLDSGDQYMIDFTDVVDWIKHSPKK